MYHGSDTMYRKYCTEKGELKKGKTEKGAEILPGTAVFVWNGEKYSHVGLYVGGGTVIEAMSTINGVTTTKVTAGKWTHYGKLAGVDYDGAEEIKAPEVVKKKPTLRKGSKGDTVKELQKQLISLGYDLGKWGADGDFGKATAEAVKAFQKANGLTADGVVGEKTWAKLEGNPAKAPEETYTVTIKGLKKSQAEGLCEAWSGATMKKE